MSDVSFHTQVAKPSASTGQANIAGALKGGSGVFSLNAGLAFWDLIVTQLNQGTQSAITQVANQSETAQATSQELASTIAAVQTPQSMTSAQLSEAQSHTDNDLAELLSGIDESVLALLDDKSAAGDEEKPMSLFDILNLMQSRDKDMPFDVPQTRVERIEKKLDLYQKLIDKLTAGMPLETKDNGALEALIGRLEQQVELLRTGEVNGEDAPLMLFIAMGLSPAELTQLGQKISKLEDKLGREITIEDIIAGVGSLIEPQKPDETSTVGIGAGNIPADANAVKQATGAPLSQPGTAAQPTETAIPSDNTRSSYQRLEEQLVKMTEQAQAQTVSVKADAQTNTPSFKAVLTAQMTPAAIANGQSWQAFFTDNLTIDGFDIHTGLPLTQAAQAAHLATTAPQAGQAHPGTQLVAASLSKMARDGGPREMTIQMDPPELGRVLAKLQFGKDKSVKAMLLVEKPETYTMLIRDAASLERALQNAGLTTDSASLSFELAQDGSAFNSNNNGQGGEPSNSGTLHARENEELIETTLTWQVDPDTGYIRYSMLA